MYWLIFLIVECTSQSIVQTSSLLTISLSVTSTDEDLEIRVSKSPADSLLLLASTTQINFSYSDGSWSISAHDYDLEGWAKSSSSELYLRISSNLLKVNSNWFIGIHKETSAIAEYTISYSRIPSTDCSSSCDGTCNGSDCQCSEYSRGYSCELSLADFSLDQKYYFSIQPYKWTFFRIPMDSDFEYITFEADKESGDPFIFVDSSPDNDNYAPSMFWHNFFLYFGDNENDYTHSYSPNSMDYWAAGVFCNSSEVCIFRLKIAPKESESSNVVWIIVIVVISMTFLCLIVPITIKVVNKIKQRNTNSLQAATVLPLQMESIYPAKKWEMDEGKDNNTCAICLDDFKQESRIRELTCNHIFHADCIDSWAVNRFSCPLCKRSMDSMVVQDLENN